MTSWLRLVFVAACFFGAPCVASALQTNAPVDDEISAAWTLERLKTQRSVVAEAPSVASEEERTRALSWWDKAIAAVTAVAPLRDSAASFTALRAEAPQRLEAQRAELERLSGPPPIDGLPLFTVADVEAQLQAAQARYSAARQALADLEAEASRRTSRRAEIPALLATARSSATRSVTPPDGASVDTSALVRAARAAYDNVEMTRAQAEVAMLEAETASYEARGELLAARLDVAEREVSVARDLVSALDARLIERRASAARSAAQEAERALRAAAGDHELVQRLAAENEAFTSRTLELTGKSTVTQAATKQVRDELESLATRRQRITDKVGLVGFTEPIAQLLRQHRASLPVEAALEQQINARRSESAQIQVEILDIQDELRALRRNPGERAEELMLEVVEDDPVLVEEVRASVASLMADRERHLDSLRAELENISQRLVDLDVEQRQLVKEVVNYRDYIDGHVLWVADAEPLGLGSLGDLARAIQTVVSPSTWTGILEGAAIAVKDAGWRAWLVVLVAIVGFMARARMRRHVMTVAEEAASRRSPSFRPTAAALAIAAINALIGPMILYLVGWLLLRGLPGNELSISLGEASMLVATLAYGLVLMRRVSLRSGLGDVHLRWPQPGRRSVRRHAWIVAVIALPLYALSSITSFDSSGVLGRVMLIASMLVLSTMTFSLFRGSGVLMKSELGRLQRTPIVSFHGLWFPLAVLAPIAVAIGAYSGFAYAASEFALRLFATWSLVATVFIVDSVMLRWVTIEQRRMRLEQARRKRDAMIAAAGTKKDGEVIAADGALDDVTIEEVDVAQVDLQTRRLLLLVTVVVLAVGLYAIWSSIFPAFQATNRVDLWSVPVETVGIDSEGQPTTITEVRNVTLGDGLFALVLIALILLALKNLPGLLEMLVLRRLPLEPGAGYAITALIRYGLVIGGVLIVAPLLGLTWGRAQWLVAAVSVGLGFGLQEIFANFVSGIILLVERPIRIGDIVTVGTTEGVITKIRMRATTIRDWERRELLVPNREFITGQVINWTLTDPITRVTFPVGVAYGTDPKLVTETLMEVARADSLVLADPPPSVVFRTFGASSLDFQLRVFIGNRDVWPRLVHGLNTEIIAAFDRKDVTIPFPQRDVHIRTYGRGDPERGAFEVNTSPSEPG